MNATLVLQAVAIVVSAIGIVSAIVWGRIVARRRATTDMLLLEQTNRDMLAIRSGFLKIIRENSILDLASIEKWYTEEAFPLVSVLNRYEVTAIGIFEG